MPKIIGASLADHRQRTRAKVFEALSILMADRSFDAITMADLASAAGIGRTTIYNHFPDKDAVVVAFASDETNRYLDRLNSALAGLVDPVDMLRTYVRHHAATSQEFHFGLGPELYGMLSREALIEIRDHVVAVERVLREILAGGIADGSLAIDDIDSSITLIHSCLNARQVPTEVVTEFVVRALRR